MIRLALVALTLAACDPAWTVRVEVRSAADVPVEAAAVGLVCPQTPSQSQAAHTGAGGRAELGSIGYFPSGCDVSVAAPGYEPLVIEARDLCPGGCPHGRDVEAVLAPRP